MSEQESKKRSSRGRKKPGIDLSDLSKAGEHLIMGATELVVGTGFAVKGVKELLQKEEGRKFVRDLPSKAVSKGFEVVKEARDILRERKKKKSSQAGSKRSRKINVE